MKLYGRLNIENTSYILIIDEQAKKQQVYIISPYHKEDIRNRVLGRPLQHYVYEDIQQLRGKKIEKDYILAVYKRTRIGQDTHYFGMSDLIDKYLDLLSLVNNYSFKKESIIRNTKEIHEIETVVNFEAADTTCAMRYTKVDGLYTSIHVKSKTLSLNVKPLNLNVRFDIKDKELIPVDKAIKAKASVASIKDVTLEDLYKVLDMSWLEYKDYRAIESIEQFEEEVIEDMLAEYNKCISEGKEFVLSLDTETTGLNIYNLDNSNPDKSFIVATPLSWKDNQGVVVFNDMENFDNVPKDYMFERLRGFLELGENVTIEIKGKNAELARMNILEGSKAYDDRVIIDRRKVNLVGHNAMFDGRVCYDNGVSPYFNNDTMQMAFNLNPKAAKGKYNNKLKGLTRRVFGHETPELSDLLGKNNEDKYKYLKDKRLAIVYGCADADYTRLLYKYLRHLMSNEAYRLYQKQDMEMINELYVSEYYGMTIHEESVKELADKAEHDMILIHEFLKNYIGKFIAKKNRVIELESLYRLGKLNDLEFKRALKEIKVDSNAKYEFDMKPNDYAKVMFDILNYPVITRTEKTNAPKTDKFVLKKLQSAVLPTPSKQMEEDLKSDDGERTLISAEQFNRLKYPVAYVLSLYKNLAKEFTAYFKPVRDQNLEGKLFKGYSLSRIETFRIMNPGQTMKGSLKAMVLPFDGGKDWYLLDFDMAQVEYRIMVSIAKFQEMIDRLKDPEKDFHTESAANIYNIPAHTVSKKLRKSCKSINFGIPYGLGDHSLCENIHGTINDKTMYETRKLMKAFKDRNEEVIKMLEHHRDEALKPRPFSREFKQFCGYIEQVENEDGTLTEVEKPVGWVKNELGRYRLFDLTDLDKKKIGSIRRAAGNFPIQSFAAELFRIILLNFRRRCIKEGIKDKIIWHMLIHDELLLSAHKSLNPFYLYKLILEECMVTLEGHTEYFVGINIGNSWQDCKDDAAEAPVLFVREMVKRWESGEFKDDTWIENPKEYVAKYMKDFIKRRIHDVLKGLQPNIDNESINFKIIDENLENYTVRAYVGDHYIPQIMINEEGKLKDAWWEFNDQERFLLSLATWSYKYYGEDKMIALPDGTEINITMLGSDETQTRELQLDLRLDDDDLMDVFDEDGEIIDIYDMGLMYDTTSYDDESGKLVELKIKTKQELIYVKETPKQLIITIPKTRYLPKVKNLLKAYADPNGISVLIKTPTKTERWCKISKDIDLFKLDSKVKSEVS